MRVKTSKVGIELIKKYEGCRLVAYKCPAGVWTIGYGHTSGVKKGDKITKTKATQLLKSDLKKYEKLVSMYGYKWTQNEFDAMVSFCYNIGSIRQITDGGMRSKSMIAAKLPLYCNAGGRRLEGLYKRRLAEQKLFRK